MLHEFTDDNSVPMLENRALKSAYLVINQLHAKDVYMRM